ncbi:Succinate dehydrogenase, cytochrome b556 subunit OS=Tsukamurella paurometabola (strain ATCC 8368 /DSM / CCUG 35730 / CIP 100753 / JCM 10117 / KCTC 9821/ NBRC 16120 / NCIMB 702349 / NCTC 13040) OX=521096 GN=Tpau_0967 PE=3 SV=1 [Tsukamurella paurometabola]|uniref:Succinate dehydrogenase, cytochrome b556 subunit n=1 Tax=Tsukamurella paurometabola (strain ATCC 8368 / DSM 20162 / CCUG 35730 / CIP 100753 / JCM 10117 / KCTC 9821 / NBRC 16120 / NCIMB 702349 / NCTC 13040) TaxID=521096 RepID=D5UUM9_TSUPD|nr:succinate dehydrogenase, cytochrome b556 subunit [Tsukamurella paurometabola]ADG77600.1 succinate dehydrogenase, cytochrome b556 subunit [Tsukamurella paurometabola DSM 20162]SUP27882.1 Succinate dehydrogenase/fumarate reductase, cytochrome b subunit [Tsukamurella paurometabola]
MSSTTEVVAAKEPRRVSLYKGDPGMLNWVLHRISGVTIFFFLFVHVLDTAVIRIDPEAYDAVIKTYKTPLIGLLEIGLVMAILFHALNGIRVILVDFWSKGVQYQKAMSIAVWVVFLITGAGMAARLLYIMFTN